MSLGLIAGLMLAQSATPAVDVAFVELSDGRNAAAIERIESNENLEADDHARLINLGVAHAREGRVEQARAMFRAAVRSETGVQLETATGEWIDSRTLARIGLQMLDRGEFVTATRVASR